MNAPKPMITGVTLDCIYEIAEREGVSREQVRERIEELGREIWLHMEMKGPITIAIHKIFGQRYER